MSNMTGVNQSQKVKRTRSRFGCHNCKRLKVKCDETKPTCLLCQKSNKKCDYSVQLTWGGRPYKKKRANDYGFTTIETFAKDQLPSTPVSLPSIASSPKRTSPNANEPEQIILDFSSTSKRQKTEKSTAKDISSQPPVEAEFPVLGYNTHFEHQFDPAIDMSVLQSTGALNTLNFESFKAFEDIETTNLAAKDFLNDYILPELDVLGDNQSSYLLELNPKIKELEQNPENLIDEETLISRNMFSSFSSSKPVNIDFNELTEEEKMLLTGFEVVPYSLAPLPDLLLKVPYFRENFHVFVEVVSVTIVVAPPSVYENNPVKVILPKMAMSSNSDGMLALLIAAGIMQSSVYRGEQHPKGIVNMLLRKSLNDLYNRLSNVNDADSDYTLALVMMLACFESIFSECKDWRAHHYGAKNIILSRGLIKARDGPITDEGKVVALGPGDESNIVFFLARWFAYVDLIGALSSSLKLAPRIGLENQLLWEAQTISKQDILELKDIDPLSGLDLRLLNHFSRILLLVKERENFGGNNPKISEASITERALEVKEDLLESFNKFENERSAIIDQVIIRQDSSKLTKLRGYDTLRAVNRLLVYAGILQIYRRVLLMSRESSLVQKLIAQITEVMRAKIKKDTPPALCTMFALFTAGCDAIDEDTRFFYGDRVHSLGQSGFRFGYEAHRVMMESWNTGKYWVDIITERNIDFGFF